MDQIYQINSDLKILQDIWQCHYCKQTKPYVDFRTCQAKRNAARKICQACEQHRSDERQQRVIKQRQISDEQLREREEKKQKIWQRRILSLQIQREYERDLEDWYHLQADRWCPGCHQILSASAFGIRSSSGDFALYTRCKICHGQMLEMRQLACCLCQRRTPRRNFLAHFKEYDLRGDGASVTLCCQECERAFLALSPLQQNNYIRASCQRAFPAGQVIYAEVDPQTQEIRYIGRTSQPERRHTQHLSDRSVREGRWGADRIPWYTRRNWVQTLAEGGQVPSMEILQLIDVAPRVLEWEQRFIFHGIQQGWRLLNREMMDRELVARIKTSYMDFLTAPFDMLVQQRFFAPQGLIAFLYEWHQPEHLIG